LHVSFLDTQLRYLLFITRLKAVSYHLYSSDAQLVGSDYSGLVYKLFTRGNEDIIALWSNADEPKALSVGTASGSTSFKQVTVTRFIAHLSPSADCANLTPKERRWVDQVEVSVERLAAPPKAVELAPLTEFVFVSVISNRPGFGWLADPGGITPAQE